VFEQNLEVLVVRQGSPGLMKVLPQTKQGLEKEGIDLVARKTKEACEIYNRLSPSRQVIAVLHLTG